MKRLEHLEYKERTTAGTARLKKRRLRGDVIKVYQYLKGGCNDNTARLLPVVPTDRARHNAQRLKHRRLLLNVREHFHWDSDCTGEQAA